MVRIQDGRAILAAPVRLPGDAAISAPEVPVSAKARPFVADKQVLQREQKPGVPTWLKTVAPLVVLLIALRFAGALSGGVGRSGGTVKRPGRPSRAASPLIAAT